MVGVVAEGLRMAIAQPAATVVTAVIVAAVCGVIVSTTGQTVAVERDVLGRIDDAGTRTILVEDTQGDADFDPLVVERIEALSDTEWAVGFGIATDVRPVGLPASPAVPIRSVFGILPEIVTTSPWGIEPGTALAGVEALPRLGFVTAAGPVLATDGPELGVVGWLRAGSPLEFLNRALLTAPTAEAEVVRIFVLADTPQRVPILADGIRSVLDPADPASVSIQTSETLVQVRAAVQGELGTYGRNLVTLVLGAGLILTALNVYGAVTTRRRDFGRRRALGASRLDIVVVVTTQTVATATVGAAMGAVVGTLVVQRIVGITPQTDFALAVACLAVMAAGVAALPPALIAAYRDPVRILRVP